MIADALKRLYWVAARGLLRPMVLKKAAEYTDGARVG
jgi:hypothetical protein